MRELLGLAGAYVVIFGTLFALAYVIDHLDGQGIAMLGGGALLFGAYYLGFRGDK